MPSPTQITVSQLARLIGTPDCPKIIDVSIDEDFNADPYLIPTATRHPFSEIETLVEKLGNLAVIVVCQKGLKLSEGAAAILRASGVNAKSLEGGNYGWRDARMGRVPSEAIPSITNATTLWVTRHRPKIDRIACPWLIRRFIDTHAKFLFVSPSQVTAVAERYKATPFDVEGVPLSHHGDQCSFETMIHHFELRDTALLTMAKIIRGADTNAHHLAPECAGLMAFSVGLSRMYKDDLKQLEAGFVFYDALYRWARDGQNETHDWAVNKTKK